MCIYLCLSLCMYISISHWLCISASVYFDDHDNDNHRHYYYSVVARTYALATYPLGYELGRMALLHGLAQQMHTTPRAVVYAS